MIEYIAAGASKELGAGASEELGVHTLQECFHLKNLKPLVEE